MSSGERTDEPLHVPDFIGKKHQVGGVVQIHSALGIQNPVSGLRTNILLVAFCWTLIYPERMKVIVRRLGKCSKNFFHLISSSFSLACIQSTFINC